VISGTNCPKPLHRGHPGFKKGAAGGGGREGRRREGKWEAEKSAYRPRRKIDIVILSIDK